MGIIYLIASSSLRLVRCKTTKEILWISISPESALPRTDSLPPRTTLRSRSRSLRSTRKAELLERKTSLLWQVSCAKEARLTRASTDCWLTEICLASGVEQPISDARTLTDDKTPDEPPSVPCTSPRGSLSRATLSQTV